MKYLFTCLAALVLAGFGVACGSQPDDAPAPAGDAGEQANAVYEFGRASRDGIGKFYMGREISFVMGHLGAGWLERPEREREERTDLLIGNLPLDADSVIADIGAGTGYFTFPIAERVPDGTVYAVDIQQEMLDIMADRKAAAGVDNVELVLGTEQDTRLPGGSVDVVLIVDAYHEFAYPREMMQGIVKGLRPGGRVVLVEYKKENPLIPIKGLHKMSQIQVKREMEAVGLQWLEAKPVVPQQHVLMFQKPA